MVPGLLWLGWTPETISRVFTLACCTALLVFMFGCLRKSLALGLGDRRTASQITLAALTLSLTLPLWAAPLAVLNGANKGFVDTIVALCPASYLASVADIDYLRGDWMYQHTPYGSLRFD